MALLLTLVILPVVALVWADQVCRAAAASRIFRRVDEVPPNDVALLLGTAKQTAHGYANLHFNNA